MKTDRTTRILLGLIALGLFLNVATDILRPEPVHAQNLSIIEADLRAIYNGICPNPKIC